MHPSPSKDEFLRVVAAYTGHNKLYFEALAGLRANWDNPHKMADAIWPWLRYWHSEFYMYGDGDPNRIAAAIAEHIRPLSQLRNRTIDTLSPDDEEMIRSLFWAFAKATGRTNKKGFQATPTGAAKVLHSLAPNLLPLWDDKILNHYRCDPDAFGYVKFCRIAKQFVAAVKSYLPNPDDRSILKRIDEFNYSYITEGHR
jgi:hypothetical protein